MRLSHTAIAFSLGLTALLASLSPSPAADPPAKTAGSASIPGDVQKLGEAPVNSAQFHARLLEVAKTYETFGRVDDEYRWAPWLCRRPQPSEARFSAQRRRRDARPQAVLSVRQGPRGLP